MTLSQRDIDTAARTVVAAKLARGVSHIEVEMILNGESGRSYSVPELGAIRDAVHAMFAAHVAAVRPERVA